jgi:hypothetical protein
MRGLANFLPDFERAAPAGGELRDGQATKRSTKWVGLCEHGSLFVTEMTLLSDELRGKA